jgi:O-methyltransferase
MAVDVSEWFLVPYLSQDQKKGLVASGDPVRYGTIFLSLKKIDEDGVPGSIAECGVYKGVLSRFLHAVFPGRKLYLFDTFEGFDPRDASAASDVRFRDTSEESVLNYIGDNNNIVVRKGFFPETAIGLEDEKFSFVMVDFDKYEPTLAALQFFYPRVSTGGFIFVHDYNSPESNWACSRALNLFLSDKPEKPMMIPDSWGTALFRKV